MKKFIAIILGSLLVLAGCATPGYDDYLTTQEKISADSKASVNVQAIALQKIATDSTDPTVQAVAAMMLGMSAGRTPQQVVAPPRDPALAWFSATTPLLGAWIGGKFALDGQKDNNATQLQMYNTQMGTLNNIATQGLSTAQTLGTVGMDYANKPPFVIHANPAPVAAPEVAPAE